MRKQADNKYHDNQIANDTNLKKIRFKQTDSSVESNDRIIRNLINSAKSFRVDWEP